MITRRFSPDDNARVPVLMGAAVKQVRGRAKARPKGPKTNRFQSPLDKAKGYEVVWPAVCDLFEAARRIDDCTFVYFIGEEDDGAVKIGKAKDPITRLRGMQTGNPRRLRLEQVLIGDVIAEKVLHEMWREYAIPSASSKGKVDALPGTEWFRPEIRKELYPITATAASLQADFAREAEGGIEAVEFERFVRQAHGVLGFVAKPRDEVRFLAAGAGYVVQRRSRI